MDKSTDTRNLAQDSPHSLELSGRVVETQVDELMVSEDRLCRIALRGIERKQSCLERGDTSS